MLRQVRVRVEKRASTLGALSSGYARCGRLGANFLAVLGCLVLGFGGFAMRPVSAAPVLTGQVRPLIFPGDATSSATAINNLGDVTGFSTDEEGTTLVFLYYSRHGNYDPGTIVPMGEPKGYDDSVGLSINHTRRVVGYASVGGIQYPALVYFLHDKPHWAVLGFPDQGFSSETFTQGGVATGVNVHDQISLFSQNDSGSVSEIAQHKWGVSPYKKYREGSSEASGHTVTSAFSHGIDEDGRVAGTQVLDDGLQVATMWQRGHEALALPPLAKNRSAEAMAITEGGATNGDAGKSTEWVEMAGYADGKDGRPHPVVWYESGKDADPSRFARPRDLHRPTGFQSARALAISPNASTIVGYAQTATNRDDAYVWVNGQAIDLNSLLPSGSPWTLNIANGVDDRGEIVGSGTFNGVQTGFLLRVLP